MEGIKFLIFIFANCLDISLFIGRGFIPYGLPCDDTAFGTRTKDEDP
jgi:hypothetical protein